MPNFLQRFGQCTDPSDYTTCHFSNVRSGLIVAMLSIGTLFGALIGATLADRLGRKKAVMIDCSVLIVGTIIQVASVSAWYQVMIGRIITGLGVGALSAVIPLYQSETAPKEIRGSLVATYQLEGGASWRIVCSLNILWALILGVGFIFAPESPRWLMGEGRPAEAEKSLARIRGVSVEDNEYSVRTAYLEMEAAVKREANMDKFNWIDCFKPKDKMLYRTLLLMTLQAGQQLTGANYFCTPTRLLAFFQLAWPARSQADQLAPLQSTTERRSSRALAFPTHTSRRSSSFFGIYIMERFGRRKPLIIGGVWQSCWLIVYAAAGTAQTPEGHQGIGNLMIISSCFFIAGYASTWAPGIWTLVGETPRNDARAKTGALATSSNWLWNFLIGFFTPFIIGSIHYSYGFVFAGCNMAGAIIVYFFLYESSGLSLENVDIMYNDPNCKPWNSNKWVPESRKDYTQGLQAEQKITAAKPVHRELADDVSNSSMEGTVVYDHRRSVKAQ
ncbi:SPOSA6832_05041 [Sporobolomyces salmonicolor]|uniref:SPOSA6832_05041-mRNA-1:cds n=1 Tax=Sporidiobolus salmonicolor TaxID=5005 RepID=A0A0D6ET71_SPOSA|nr:SPOSA6832_05041 [Sporobolomyces salmonicolor]